MTADELESNSWVIWYTFEIAYNALSDEVLNEELLALIDEATIANDSYEAGRVAETGAALEEAISEGQAASDNADIAQMQAAIESLKAAIAEQQRSYDLINEFDKLVMEYNEALENLAISSTDNELLQIIDKSEEDFESNAEIEALIERLPTAMFNYVVGRDDFNEGAEDNPIDLTGVIKNPEFSGNTNYWTITGTETDEEGNPIRIGQNQGYQSASYENEDCIISQFIEAWRPDGTPLNNGTISQTLLGALPKGYYSLEMDGFATNQAEIPEEGITGAFLYVEVGGKEGVTPIGISVTSGKPEHFSIVFYSDGTSIPTIGLKVEGTNASWITADNFTLSFLGTEQPVGVSSLDSETKSATVYTLAGTRVANLRKGINIVLSNGKAQKVLVK